MKNQLDSLLKAKLNPPKWMLSLTEDINDWLKNLETGDGVGCYRFSKNYSERIDEKIRTSKKEDQKFLRIYGRSR